mgnify:CR=1 FL=1
MPTFGIARVKDELDVIESTVRRMLEQVDRVLVVDNASTDGTRELLRELSLGAPSLFPDLVVLDDPDVAYYQSERMTELAADAARRGASWVVPFDADEVWRATDGRRIADVLAELPSNVALANARLYDHVATGDDDELELDPVARMRYRRLERGALPKCAVRVAAPVVIEQGNHGAHYPADAVDGLLEVRHYPYRSVEQFVSKARNGAAAYAATTLPETTGQHWRDYGRLLDAGGPAAIEAVFREHFYSPDPGRDRGLILDPVDL